MEAQSSAARDAAAATSPLPGMGAIPHPGGVAFRVWAPHADQVAVSGSFGKRIGVLEATAFGAIGGALIVCTIVLVTRQTFGGVVAGFREPPWLWLNAVMGAIVVLTITFTAPRIGTFATIGLLIAGQLAMGVLIDYYGLFGLERIPLSAARIAVMARNWYGAPVRPYQASLVIASRISAPGCPAIDRTKRRTSSGKISS